MAITRVTFGEWLPDQPGVIGALTTAKNVYPRAVGYGPFPSEEDYSDAAAQDLTNVVAGRDTAGNTRVFASGTTRLYRLDSSDFSLDDVSGITYSGSTMWKFTQFGNKVIGASEAHTMQAYDLTTTSNFANLSSDAPKARFVTVVRDFVVSGYQTDYQNRVQWSGINNETTWATSATTQADFQDIPDGGRVQGVTDLGCYESNSVIQWQGVTYFLSDDGFYACDGQNVVNIGAEKVNRFFFNTLREANIDQMSAAADASKNLVMWGYPSTDLTYRILIYHITTKRWSYADTTINRIATSSTPGVTLEGLDSFSASIDALQTPLDSRLWIGGKLQLAGVSGAKIITFSGPAKTGTIDTADISADSSQSMITLVKPIVDDGTGSVAIDSRLVLNEQVNFPSVTAANSENRVGVRSYGRYHRVRLQPSGNNWSSAIGVDVEIQQAGTR